MDHIIHIDNATFATSLVEPALRLHHYRKWLQAVCETRLCEAANLHASVLVVRVGDILIARSNSSPANYVRNQASDVDRSLDDYVFVQFVVKGELSGAFDDDTLELAEGDIFLCDMARTTDLWVDDVEHIHVLVPRRYLAGIQGPLHGRVVPRTSIHCRMLRERLRRLFDAGMATAGDQRRVFIRDTIDLLVRCANNEPLKRQSPDSIEQTRQAVIDYINTHLTVGTLSPETLQYHFALSRARLYRLFADMGGIQRYIRERRLDGAIRDICRHPKHSIAETAKRYGFSNNRQFQRAIRSRFGITARDARARWGGHMAFGDK